MLRNIFVNLKKGTEYLNYGRHIISNWSGEYFRLSADASQPHQAVNREFHVLDIGCGHGEDLKNIRQACEKVSDQTGSFLKIFLHGIENYRPYLDECRESQIDVHSLDIEHDSYSFPDASMDIIVANQVLEHTKEIFWIFSEAARILKPGGRFIIGVPNLASFHNRILLLFGIQPTAQKSMSAHVRTFTRGDLKEFGETGGIFSLSKSAGSNFYPFPPFISKPLSRMFPSFAWGLFVCFEKKSDGVFLDCLYSGEVLETPFYGGPQNPAESGRDAVSKKKSARNPVKKSVKKSVVKSVRKSAKKR